MHRQLGLSTFNNALHPASGSLSGARDGASALAQKSVDQEKKDFFSQLDTPLDQSLRFDHYLVGDANRLAYAAARNVVDGMTVDDRLVYFYGASGLGKTHLLNAIGHALREKRPQLRIFYLTYENFLTTYVDAVISKNLRDLRGFLHDFDVVMLDDLHLLRGRKGTQEEFLNLINRLHQEGKTVVIAGAMAPQRLAETGINQRLTDRLAGGTSIQLEKPDLRLRLAILQSMNDRHGRDETALTLPTGILEQIARRADSSVRELEGAYRLVRLHAQAHGEIPASAQVAKMLAEHFRHHRKEVTLDNLKEAVAQSFGWSIADLEGPKRPQPLAKARHAYCMLARKLTHASLAAIGASLQRDHTTVISSLERGEALAETDIAFADKISRLLEQFGA